jgi:hypothetical protein
MQTKKKDKQQNKELSNIKMKDLFDDNSQSKILSLTP